ncbi:MarC family protein [Campylobacter novaezeelandiae]|uniref:MarC family protein n=1 Tax=Campylobacter novaezeelandiae TaxID=2267891 RepID=UPI001037B4D4|nr:MarC family protein [Campylobacter novaezeelandiae]MBK1964603.1 MarC family protein [Campylobacter novaezeelandiae]MBK1993392.1 MarC family protein [Campylobacter novaezeelandiae]TBR78577.1 MarC family protein [Campylobacter novaezeelandiae]
MFVDLESEFHLILVSAIALLAVLNPFGNLTQFIAMSEGLPTAIRKKLFRNILYTACLIVLVFLFSGSYLMVYIFRIDLDHLRIAGGLILMIMAVRNLLFSASIVVEDFSHYQDLSEKEFLRKSLIPMAFPMLVGPGTLAAVVVIREDSGLDVALGATVLAFMFMFFLFHFAATIEKIFGKLILHVFSRIVQVFIVAMGIKMILLGLTNLYKL